MLFYKKKKHRKIENKPTEIWSGDYSAWAEAKSQCTGYNSDVILEKCKTSLLKVKNGEATYERDSVLFDEIQYSWGLLAGLQRAALENNVKLCVLDFGGSLGSTYYQNKEFLGALKELQWCIVEQSHFVDFGKLYFEDEQLHFFYTIEECLSKHKPDVILFSSVLQYLEKPFEWIEKILSLEVPNIIIDRTAFVNNERDILTIQNVPEEIYEASYPAWFFNKEKLLKAFEKKYSVLAVFNNGFTNNHILNGKYNAYWQGIILKK